MSDQHDHNSSQEIEVNEQLHQAAAALVQAQQHKVLLVEDTAAHAAIIRRALDAGIWEVEHVTRASTALQTFELDPSRIVLLDLSLPDADGMQLLTRLHTINAQAPIIVVTATDQVRVSVEAMQKGAWDYVVKANPNETAQRIVSALERAWQGRVRAAESQLIEQSRLIELVRAQRLEAIESIVKTVCCDINNPLSGVVALSQLILQRENLDADLQRLADGIARSATQVAEVVEKLKTINEGSSELKPPQSSGLNISETNTLPTLEEGKN